MDEHFLNRENIRIFEHYLREPDIKNNPGRHALLLRLLAQAQGEEDKPPSK